MSDSSRSPATRAVTAGRGDLPPGDPLNPPVVFASTYAAGGAVGYARSGNPTWTALETAIGALEDGEALAYASGLAAAAGVLDLLPAGAVVVAPAVAYTGVRELLEQRVVERKLHVRWVPMADADEIAGAVAGADLLWLESPTNPLLDICDLRAAAAAAHEVGALTVVDNTFATPLGQRPLDLGADVSLHSATKQLSGHSDLLLGAVIVRDAGLRDRLADRRTLLGAVPGPMEAWLALRGIRTLAVRHERACANAAELAARLAAHPAVHRVRYPGLPGDPGHSLAASQMQTYGSMVAVEVAGDADLAERVCAGTRLWVHATSLGGVESSLERRRRWPAETADVPESLLRLSVGIEDVEDLWRDLDEALSSAG